MQLETKSLRKTINKAFLKETTDRSTFNYFRTELEQLLANIKSAEKKDEHEEHFKNLLASFLNEVGFNDYYINTSGRIDLAIHTDGKVKDPVGVLLEVKRPSNRNEMITEHNFNRKAMHEAVLYYLEQRIEEENEDLKQIVITDTLNWFVFDAQEFERCYYRPSYLKKMYESWKTDQKVSSNNDFMYDKIADFIDKQNATTRGLYLDLSSYKKFLKAKEGSEAEKKLIPLYKFFSPTQLLKEPFANDSNTLNREFYKELLYILGLEEKAKSNTRYIERAEEGNRHPGSFIENTIRILDAEDHLSTVRESTVKYGSDRGDQLFNVALELSIIWMNRLLFLKLLEAQLFRYHRQDKKFKFLKSKTIDDFDELNKLFFQVLARRESERTDDINEKFGHIPYLNSSLFDPAPLEHQTVFISNLDDKKTLPVYNRSVLNERRGDEINTLEYLFAFLDAYDFAAEGGEEVQEERKTLINASVLGLIFEKINGYKDGSFFTPGFITEYMARETLRKTVADKFSEVLGSGSESPSPQGPLSNSLPRGERMGQSSKAEDGGRQGSRGMSGATPGDAIPEELLKQARYLRKNQTEAEALLWELLRNRQLYDYKFRRQHPIEEGVVLDFYCHKAKLAIEVDGGYHDTDEQQAADAERTEILNEMGIRVIRFRNEEVLDDTKTVLNKIAGELENPLSNSLPEGERTLLPSPAGGRTEDGGPLTFTQIYNRIGRDISIEKANEIVNSVTICDPAVGSGHFLVSSLNELLAIKSDLGILCDRDGKMLRDVKVAVENDDLIVTYGDEELFEYDVAHTWHGNRLAERKVSGHRQRIQKALFHEKRHMIENCLFGVDINANSVKICRLRLWIELLKNTYYTEQSNHRELEVLPNIDINIKTGNSLVSRFDLDSDLSSVFKDSDHSLDDYKEAVRSYKNTGDRSEKQRLQQLIDDIKDEYSTTLRNNRPINRKLSKQRGRLELMQNADLFGDKRFTKKEVKKQKKKVQKLKQKKEEQESGVFYNQAFEWRFEFPEVLDEDGSFTGFDAVIGNPPYISVKDLDNNVKSYYRDLYFVAKGQFDLYLIFVERAMDLLRKGAYITMITSNTYLSNKSCDKFRQFIVEQKSINEIINLDETIFSDAKLDVSIISLLNERSEDYSFKLAKNKKEFLEGKRQLFPIKQILMSGSYELKINLNHEDLPIFKKLHNGTIHLGDITNLGRGMEFGSNSEKILDENCVECLPIIVGGDISRYSIDSITGFAKHETNKRSTFKKLKDFGGPRILIQRIRNLSLAKRIVATFTHEDILCTNTLRILSIKNEDYSYKFLLGILNSSLLNYFFRKSFNNKDIYAYQLAEIPIKVSDIESNQIRLYVDQILTAKEEDPEADITDLEDEIDRLVYELYGLSEKEIALVKGSAA